MEKLRLPFGIQNLSEIRRDGHYYVDKTDYVSQLAQHSKYCFLSRPRSFGKSLLVDTIKQAFEGNKELFEGLAIHGKWDWSVSYPVIRFDFNAGHFVHPDGVLATMNAQLSEAEEIFGVKTSQPDTSTRLLELVDGIYESTGLPVVVLVDECNRPILDAIEQPEVALSNCSHLQSFYSVLNCTDTMVRFALFAGASCFARASLFSGLDQIVDISLFPQYSAMCGWTDSELDAVFGPELEGLDRERVKEWYSGYNWLGEERVYCPQDLQFLFNTRRFGSWWYESEPLEFLLDMLQNRRLYSTEIGTEFCDESTLTKLGFDEQTPEALLFQTGYLTIAETKQQAGETLFRLDYPNLGVRRGINGFLESTYLHNWDTRKRYRQKQRLVDHLEDCNASNLEKHLNSLFSSIPRQWHDTSQIENYEAHCASVLLSHFLGAHLYVHAEAPTSQGCIDLATVLDNRVYIFEFKIAERSESGEGMEQMRSRGYADKYRGKGLPIHLVSVEYSSEKRNIVNFCLEDA